MFSHEAEQGANSMRERSTDFSQCAGSRHVRVSRGPVATSLPRAWRCQFVGEPAESAPIAHRVRQCVHAAERSRDCGGQDKPLACRRCSIESLGHHSPRQCGGELPSAVPPVSASIHSSVPISCTTSCKAPPGAKASSPTASRSACATSWLSEGTNFWSPPGPANRRHRNVRRLPAARYRSPPPSAAVSLLA